jgi:hypothetical protein
MYETEPANDAEKPFSRVFIWGLGVGAVITLSLIYLIYSQSKYEERPVLERVVRAGTPEYDSYKDKVVLEVTDKITYPNLIGMFQIEVQAKMHNRGDRVLTGVEVLAKMLDMSDKVIAQNTGIPIPRIRPQPLKPGESIPISVKVDAPSRITEGEVKDITIELRGLQFD